MLSTKGEVRSEGPMGGIAEPARNLARNVLNPYPFRGSQIVFDFSKDVCPMGAR